MSKIIIFSIVLLILLSVPTIASDLYLLNINSQKELNNVNSIVDHARGTIDNRFIVDLNNNQITALKSAGIQIELMQLNCNLDETYLVLKEHRRIRRSAVSFNSFYETGISQVVSLEKSSLDILAREGYMPLVLSEKKTPFFYNEPMLAMKSLDSYPTDSLADMIEYDSLFNIVTRLEGFYTRYIKSDSCIKSRNWIRDKFFDYGYTNVFYQTFLATRESFNAVDVPAYNVVCVKEGTTRPDEWIIIGGHYDSFVWACASNDDAHAPGADDNASGVAAVLELARIFKDYDFKRSVMFVAFGAEEEGLWGSEYIANEMYENNENVLLALNFDVISYEGDAEPDFLVTTVMQKGYGQVFVDAAIRLGELIPNTSNNAQSSDDRSFDSYGIQSVGCFEDEWHPDMHTIMDTWPSLDFGLLKNITDLGAVSVPIIDASPDPIEFIVADVGNGEALRVSWDDCSIDWSYRIIYGSHTYSMNDTIDVPILSCEYDIYGLTEGTEYYFAVVGRPDIGYPPIGYFVNSNTPYQIPKPPNNLFSEPTINSVSLNWTGNTEVDLSHYKVIRKIAGETNWSTIADNITEPFFNDASAVNHETNSYMVFSVDNDLNESDSSESVSATPVTLDGGILLVDETQDVDGFPSETDQDVFYAAILDTFNYDFNKIDEGGYLTRSKAGQYNPIFWIDDDFENNELSGSIDSLAWYLNIDETNVLVAGWSTIYSMTGQTYFYEGDFYYDQFGITYIAENSNFDFTGATGVNGWPDLELNSDIVPMSRMSNIDRFAVNDKAETIFTFNTSSGNPAFEGKPLGVAYDTRNGKRVILGFPLYYLTEESATALITKVMSYFAEESEVYFGDANDDWVVNILDVTYLISYLYKDGLAPVILNNADSNNSCNINILDITYLISYLYKGGPEPLEGCVD